MCYCKYLFGHTNHVIEICYCDSPNFMKKKKKKTNIFYIRDDFVTNHKTAYVDYEWIEKFSLCVLLDLHHDPVQAACTILMKMSASNTMTWSQPRAAAWPKSLQKCLTHRWFTPTRSIIFLKIVFLMLSWIKIGPDCFLKLLLLWTIFHDSSVHVIACLSYVYL